MTFQVPGQELALESAGTTGKIKSVGEFLDNAKVNVQRFSASTGDDVAKVGGELDEVGNATSEVIRDGSQFDELGKLKPNVTYQTGEFEYLYQTDDLGRLDNWHTDELQLTERDVRLRHDPNTLGKLPGDHAGHLAGDRFGGSPELDNLVSQLSGVNLSDYKKLENQWARVLEEGKDVSVKVKVNYVGDSLRPDSFDVVYKIDGKRTITNIPNC